MSELATILSSIALSLRSEAEKLEDLAGIQRNRSDLVRELIATLRGRDSSLAANAERCAALIRGIEAMGRELRKEPIPRDPVHQSMGQVKW